MEERRALPHEEGKEVFIQHDFDFYSCVYYKEDNPDEPVFFLKNQQTGVFERLHYTYWYMITVFEKLRKFPPEEIQQVDQKLVYDFWWAVREGYNHRLDPNLKQSYDCPRIRNTVKAVRAYVKRICEKSEARDKGE